MTAAPAPGSSGPIALALRTTESGGIALGVVLIGILHLVPPTSGIDPVTVTISEYGRTWLAGVFVAAVALIAIGSAATLVLLVRAGACRPLSVPSLGIALWVLGMIGVAMFQKADWAAGATWDGYVHRAASVVAFVALPVAIVVLAAGEVRRRGLPRRASRFDHHLLGASLALAIVVLGAIVVFGVYIGASEAEGVPWWTVLPIGLAERLLVFAELGALAMLVVALRVSPSTTPARLSQNAGRTRGS